MDRGSTRKNMEESGPGDWSNACVLSRANSLICPFLQAHARRQRRRKRRELEGEAKGREVATARMVASAGTP
jgi:hypothetical protein